MLPAASKARHVKQAFSKVWLLPGDVSIGETHLNTELLPRSWAFRCESPEAELVETDILKGRKKQRGVNFGVEKIVCLRVFFHFF